MSTISKRKIWFVRHAQSEYNKQRLFTGWHDPALTDLGISAACELKEKLSSVKFDHIFSSPLKRASITAISIVGDSSLITYDDRLKERSYGDWSGLKKEEIKDQVGEQEFLAARRGWDTKPPNGESLKDVITRLKPFWDDFKGLRFNKDENHLIVAHSNSLRAIIKILEKMGTRLY